MAESPNEAELEQIFERLRQEYIISLEDVRSDAAIVERINAGLRYHPLKNLGEESKDALRDIGVKRRGELRIKIKRRMARRRKIIYKKDMWTAGQIEQLRYLYAKRYIPVERIAYKTGRSKRAIYIKASRLGIKRRA